MMKQNQSIFFCCWSILFFSGVSHTMAQEVIPLYPDGEIPNSISIAGAEKSDAGADGILRVSQVSIPTLTAYFPPADIPNTGKAIIICPGGGYRILAIAHEGYDVAELFARQGIAAFVLKYRLPFDNSMEDRFIGPLQDAQRAMQIVRSHATEWGIETDQIGIGGFSAGGHVAASLAAHYHTLFIDNPENISLRPDFSLLVYPLISVEALIQPYGSLVERIFGDQLTPERIIFLSTEHQVSGQTPPAFLVHAEDDRTVPVSQSELYLDALKKAGIQSKLITYPAGGHGFGLNNKTTEDKWFDHFVAWLLHP